MFINWRKVCQLNVSAAGAFDGVQGCHAGLHGGHTLADRLLPLIAVALQLPTDFFDMHFDKPMIALRPLHYSAQTSLPDEVRRHLHGHVA